MRRYGHILTFIETRRDISGENTLGFLSRAWTSLNLLCVQILIDLKSVDTNLLVVKLK